MVEGQLEAIRRQIHEAEERLKKSSAEHGNAKPPLAEMKDQELATTPPPPSARPPDEKPDKLREELAAAQRSLRNLEAQVAGMKGFIDAVMRSGAVPVFLLRKDGLIMEANRAGCQRLVVEQEQLLNLHLQDFIVGSARTDFQALLGHATAQQLVSGTYRFLRARGKEFVASVSLVGVADAKGTVSRILVTMERLQAGDPVPEAEGRV